jgi:hypothetical protein
MVAEELRAVVNAAVAISVHHEKRLVAPSSCPANLLGHAVCVQVKAHAVCRTREVVAVSLNVHDQGAVDPFTLSILVVPGTAHRPTLFFWARRGRVWRRDHVGLVPTGAEGFPTVS